MSAPDTVQTDQTKIQPPDETETQALVERPAGSKLTSAQIEESYGLTDAEYTVLLRTVCKNAPREIATFFMLFCKNKKLDPFSKQVYLWPDKTDNNGLPAPGCNWNIVAGIDGLRAIASRSPYYRGPKRPVWSYKADEKQPDGIARFGKEASKWGSIEGKRIPLECEVTIMRAVPQAPTNAAIYMEFAGIARFDEFVKRYGGKIGGNWEAQPEHQLRVRAEAMALRMAFPEEVGGIYTEDEMRDVRFEQEAAVLPPDVEFSDEEKALAKEAGWSETLLLAQFKRFGDHGTLLDALRKMVESRANSSRNRARGYSAKTEEEEADEAQIGETFETAQADIAPGSLTDKTRKTLFGALRDRGISAKADRIAFAKSLGVEVESFTQLSEDQGQALADTLTVMVGDERHARVMGQRCLVCEESHGNSHAKDCPIDEEE